MTLFYMMGRKYRVTETANSKNFNSFCERPDGEAGSIRQICERYHLTINIEATEFISKLLQNGLTEKDFEILFNERKLGQIKNNIVKRELSPEKELSKGIYSIEVNSSFYRAIGFHGIAWDISKRNNSKNQNYKR